METAYGKVPLGFSYSKEKGKPGPATATGRPCAKTRGGYPIAGAPTDAQSTGVRINGDPKKNLVPGDSRIQRREKKRRL